MTEPKVVRYLPSPDHHMLEGHSKGTWVRYSDYEALAARVQKLERLVEGYRLNAYDDAIEENKLLARVEELEECYKMCCRDRDALSQHESVLAENKRLQYRIEEAERMLSVRVDDEMGLAVDNTRLAARVQELEEKHEDSEYRNVHLEKLTDDLQAENTQLREDFSKFYNALCAGITQTAELPLATQFIFEMDGDDWDAFADTMAALKEKPASVFGRDPMNAPDVTDILKEKP